MTTARFSSKFSALTHSDDIGVIRYPSPQHAMQGSNGNRHWCVRGPWRPRNRLEPFFKGKRSSAITPAIRDYIRQRQAERAANGTINRELAALERMFNLAIDGGTLRHKPKIPMLRESDARQGFFEREQFENVRAHLLPHFDLL